MTADPFRSRHRGRDTGATGGYTLLELMVTIALASVLMGVGAGVYVSMGQRSAYGQMQSTMASLVTQARNTSSHMPAQLVIEPQEGGGGRVYALTEQTLQELRFEVVKDDEGNPIPDARQPHGINSLTCDYVGATVDEHAGRVGGGLRVAGHAVDCGKYGNYDATDGINASIWVNPDGASFSPLISKGTHFQLRLELSAQGQATLIGRIGVKGETGGYEELRRSVKIPGDVRAGEWLGCQLVYDRKDLVLRVDFGNGPIEIERYPENREMRPDPDAPLTLVGGNFAGVIDDFRLGGVIAAEPIKMPDGVYLLGGPKKIRFVAGRLDPELHPGTERIGLGNDGRTTWLEIGQNGQVQGVTEEEPEAQVTDVDDDYKRKE